MPIIQIENLSKSYSYYEKKQGLGQSFKNLFFRKKMIKNAVTSISFNVEEGEFVGFIGPNGAGKTTTLKMLSGILYPTSGSASVLGYVPWERKKGFKMNFSLVMGQKSQLFWDLPAIESFHLNQTIYEIDDNKYKRILGRLVELLGVEELLKVQVRRLSLGERMKMELIASLLHEPKVLLLDEPTIGLDVLSQKNMREFLKSYNSEQKTTILLTSHYMHDIQELCERIVLIHMGKILFDGKLKDLTDKISTKKIIRLELEKPVAIGEISRFGQIKLFSPESATLEIERDSIKSTAKLLLDHLPIIDLTIEDVPIEETIALLYQKKEEGS
jgi:ABC-2 type transport system ATP-binding protein